MGLIPPATLPFALATIPPPEHWAALLVASAFFLAGVALLFVPLMPGSLVVWLGIVGYKLWLGDAAGVPWWFVFGSGVVVLLVYLFDLLCGWWGAKKFGGTWRGALGALLGGVIGIFLPPQPWWLLLGPVIGAIIGELLGGRKFAEAGKAGLGTVVGAIIAYAFKISATIILIAWFYWLALTANG